MEHNGDGWDSHTMLWDGKVVVGGKGERVKLETKYLEGKLYTTELDTH